MVFPTNRGGDDFPWRLYVARSVQASRYRRRPHAHSTARFLRPKGRCSDERTVKCGTKGPPRILPLINADLAGSASWRLCEILEVRECGRSISAQSQGFAQGYGVETVGCPKETLPSAQCVCYDLLLFPLIVLFVPSV